MKLTFDLELIKSFLFHPEIFNVTCDTSRMEIDEEREAYQMDETSFYCISDDAQCLLMFSRVSSGSAIELHSAILPESRGNCKFYFDEGMAFLKEVAPQVKTVLTYSPINNPSAVHGAIKCGFIAVGEVFDYSTHMGDTIKSILFQYRVKG